MFGLHPYLLIFFRNKIHQNNKINTLCIIISFFNLMYVVKMILLFILEYSSHQKININLDWIKYEI